ncbi:Uncharacterized protein APZ42_006809, partial [Daphnia magna]
LRFICVFFSFPVMTHHDPAHVREPLVFTTDPQLPSRPDTF